MTSKTGASFTSAGNHPISGFSYNLVRQIISDEGEDHRWVSLSWLAEWIVSLPQPARAGTSSTNTARFLGQAVAYAGLSRNTAWPLETDYGRNNSHRPPNNLGSRFHSINLHVRPAPSLVVDAFHAQQYGHQAIEVLLCLHLQTTRHLEHGTCTRLGL